MQYFPNGTGATARSMSSADQLMSAVAAYLASLNIQVCPVPPSASQLRGVEEL
jgi:hypothetical protein